MAKKKESYIGKTFGELTVVEELERVTHPNGKTSRFFKCKCKCGNYTNTTIDNLKRKGHHSCGHCGRPHKLYDVIKGKKYGRLTIIRESSPTYRKNGDAVRMVECLCKCGSICCVPFINLRNGISKSCGCLAKDKLTERSLTHGLAHKHPLYEVWRGIKQRCYNSNASTYKDYGGRGISICSEWSNNFSSFYKWSIEHGWKKGLSIDRIDNAGNYCPENCRYVNNIIQARNKRSNKEIEYQGQKWHSLAEFCEKYNLNYKNMQQRLYRGYTLEHAVELDKKRYPYNEETAKLIGTTHNYKED